MFTNPIRLPCTAAIFCSFTRFTTPKRTRFSLSFSFLSMFYSHTHTHTNSILLIFLSRACKVSHSVSTTIAHPLQSAAARRCLSFSLHSFSFFSFFLYSPMCRLLTLCIRCNRVLVFRQAAFRKTVASFAGLFSHSTRDPLEVGFAAYTGCQGNSA